MRTFEVTVDGSVHIIRVFNVHTPAVTGQWEFISRTGEVLWSYAKERISRVYEVDL